MVKTGEEGVISDPQEGCRIQRPLPFPLNVLVFSGFQSVLNGETWQEESEQEKTYPHAVHYACSVVHAVATCS